MRRPRRSGWWRTTGAVLTGACAFALASTSAAAQDAELSISRVDTAAFPTVSLEVSAPSGLTGGQVAPSDITVLENRTPVAFEVAQVPTASLEVVLLFDTSGSMRENGAIDAAKAAAAGFLDALPPEVQVGIVAFNDAPSLVSPLTSDRGLLQSALAGLQARGETALYDAIVFAQSLFSGGTTDRQFVLLSDGGDTVSASTLDDAVAVTRQIRTSAIELISSEANQQALEQLTQAGQGVLSSVSDPQALDGLYLGVANSLVNRYRLTFTSEATGRATYTVRVNTPDAALEASTSVELPATPTTEPTTVPPAATTAAPTATTGPAGAGGSGGASSTCGAETGPSTVWLVLGASAIYVALASLLLMAWPGDRTSRVTRRQLGVADRPSPAATTGESLTQRITSAADRALERRGKQRGLAQALDVAGINLRPGEFVVFALSMGLTAAVVLLALVGPVGFIIALVAAPLVARAVVSARAQRRREAFAEQLPDVLQLLISSLRAGYAVPQGLDAVANQSAEPARSEFQRVMFESRIGRDLSESLAASAQRMQSRDFDWVVSSFEINREIGGDLAQVLDNVARTIRERQQLKRQIKTLTAEGRISAYVLTALPFLMALVIGVITSGYFEPLTRGPGPLLMGAGVVLMVIGWIWMRRLIRAQL